MLNITWASGAINDLARLRRFIAKENPEAAERAARAIIDTVNRLTHHPQIGKPIPDLLEYRDWLIRFGSGGYVLRYRVHEENLFILHIRHYREKSFQIDLLPEQDLINA